MAILDMGAPVSKRVLTGTDAIIEAQHKTGPAGNRTLTAKTVKES